MSSHLTAYLRTGAEPKPRGNDHSFAGNSCYDTADGRVMLGASNRRQHERLGHALDRPELAAQSHNDFREDHRAEQAAEIAEILSGRSAEEWEAYLQDRSEEHTSELQSLMRNSYAVFRLQKKQTKTYTHAN